MSCATPVGQQLLDKIGENADYGVLEHLIETQIYIKIEFKHRSDQNNINEKNLHDKQQQQAGAELGQAQPKLELDSTLILFRFGLI